MKPAACSFACLCSPFFFTATGATEGVSPGWHVAGRRQQVVPLAGRDAAVVGRGGGRGEGTCRCCPAVIIFFVSAGVDNGFCPRWQPRRKLRQLKLAHMSTLAFETGVAKTIQQGAEQSSRPFGLGFVFSNLMGLKSLP